MGPASVGISLLRVGVRNRLAACIRSSASFEVGRLDAKTYNLDGSGAGPSSTFLLVGFNVRRSALAPQSLVDAVRASRPNRLGRGYRIKRR
jgi:hypothetical protein